MFAPWGPPHTAFNFGELLMHPILKSLEGQPQAWMSELLDAFNKGDVDAYHQVASPLPPFSPRARPASRRLGQFF